LESAHGIAHHQLTLPVQPRSYTVIAQFHDYIFSLPPKSSVDSIPEEYIPLVVMVGHERWVCSVQTNISPALVLTVYLVVMCIDSAAKTAKELAKQIKAAIKPVDSGMEVDGEQEEIAGSSRCRARLS
jgi:hypothetical protein